MATEADELRTPPLPPAGEPEAWNENVAVYTPLRGHTPEPEPVLVSPGFAASFSIEAYLAEEHAKDLLRFSTAGSVDDGKSTLIGRLLYDTQSVYDDQIRSIEGKGTTAPGVLDLALLTDGLRAEREQGITIDVAYRYFSTARRKFIIADTPGHEQYTRNMATGASTADVAIVLADARKGVLLQSRRHAYITALLGVPHIVVAVNKMDLVGYDQATFAAIERDFRTYFASLPLAGREQTGLHFIPVSALAGDNVARASQNMPWYTGPTLLGLLEALPSSQLKAHAPFRMALQRVVRPHLDFRGFAGQIAAGQVAVGDEIVVQPSGQRSIVRRIVTFDGDLPSAQAPLSVTLTLADEIDASRGDLLASAGAPAEVGSRFAAALVWMDSAPLELGKRYLLKHGSRTVPALVRALRHAVALDAPAGEPLHAPAGPGAVLGINGIGEAEIETLQPLAADPYARNRHTGSFVLIDPQTHATAAAGMMRAVLAGEPAPAADALAQTGPVTPEERIAHRGHRAAALVISGPEDLAHALERALLARGALVVRVDAPPAEAANAFRGAGALVLSWRAAAGPGTLAIDDRAGIPVEDAAAALAALHHHGVLQRIARAPSGETV